MNLWKPIYASPGIKQMKSEVHPLRVLLKALFLFVVLNVFFALVDPPVGKLTVYNFVIPGRLRFPYDDTNLPYINYVARVDDDYDAMFGEHVISKRKSASEFRLILLGNSATWGFGLPANKTLSEQINQLNIQTCDGRVVRAYNLAYPSLYVVRDLLILDKAMEHQPDMVLWIVTLNTFEPKVEERELVAPHWKRYQQLVDAYHLKLSYFSPPIQEPPFWDKTIIGQRKRLKNIALSQMFGILWAGTGIDNRKSTQPEPTIPSLDVKGDLKYFKWSPNEAREFFDSLLMDVASAGFKVAGDVPVVLVNEPIFVAEGENHLVRYNWYYPRWVYDEYRQFLFHWTDEHHYKFLDYWNALSPEDFYDQPIHLRSVGQKHFAELLAPEINKLACPR